MIIIAFKLIFFIVSMAGIVIYLYRKLKLQIEFLPITTISIISVALFFAGILNILSLMSSIIYIIGLFLFVVELRYYYKNNLLLNLIRIMLTSGLILYIIANAYFILILKDQRLIHYDNFSHWGLIVKNILMNNRLPNFEDTIIGFSSYPPGAALFIYYFCKHVGVSEGLALIGQMIIILSGLLSIFSFSSFEIFSCFKNKSKHYREISLNIISIFISIYLLAGASSIHDLLVDTLLNIIGISLFAIIYYYFDTPKKIIVPVTFISSFLVIIKNSGLFFVFISLLIYAMSIFYNARKNHNSFLIKIKNNLNLFLPFSIPISLNYLWSNHVSMVFSSTRLSKHTMSIKNYTQIFDEKSQSEIIEITNKYIDILKNMYVNEYKNLVILIVSLLIITFIIRKKIDKRLVGVGVIITSIFIIYSFGLWAMYLVSMPTYESLRLAGHSRYMKTMLDYIAGIVSISIIYNLSKSDNKATNSYIHVFFIFYFGFQIFNENNIDNTKRIFQNREFSIEVDTPWIANIDASFASIASNPMRSNLTGKYLIYYPNENATDYENYFTKYRLHQSDFKIIKTLDDPNLVWEYDYLSVTFIDVEITEFFNEFSNVEPKIGTYTINKDEQTISE